jgi:hypothetical protein
MSNLTNEQIWEGRFDAAIERFGSFDECMEISGYGVELETECPPTPILTDFEEYQINLQKRFEACKQRYKGMEEYMEIPDMDLWLKLKNEIVPKNPLPKLERQICQTFYTLDSESFYNFDEFQNISMEMNDVREFEPTFDEFKTVFMPMNSSDYIDDYDNDTYSMDSTDKHERRAENFKDKWSERDD